MHKKTKIASGKTTRTYDAYRSMRIPLTLIDASTRPAIAAALTTIAASQRNGPCHCVAQHLAQIARQITDSYTQAQAIANYTTTPAPSTTFLEATLTESSFTERAFLESSASPP